MALSSRLRPEQGELLERWFRGAALVADHSWGLTDTTVLHLRHDGNDLVLKAAGPQNHHIEREITAHEGFTTGLAEDGGAARLLRSDRGLRMLVTTYLPGVLVEGTEAEWREDTYRRAGALLARFHAQEARATPGYEEAADAKSLAWLDQPHRIAADTEARLRAELTSGERGATTLVPTHGDWQPRNWLVDGERVRVIDFGRFDWRPAATDLARLASQQLLGRPDLERAFFEGYGEDPRDPAGWRLVRIREAIGTAVWAFQFGDAEFEAQGHRMIRDALDG